MNSKCETSKPHQLDGSRTTRGSKALKRHTWQRESVISHTSAVTNTQSSHTSSPPAPESEKVPLTDDNYYLLLRAFLGSTSSSSCPQETHYNQKQGKRRMHNTVVLRRLQANSAITPSILKSGNSTKRADKKKGLYRSFESENSVESYLQQTRSTSCGTGGIRTQLCFVPTQPTGEAKHSSILYRYTRRNSTTQVYPGQRP